MFLLRAPVSVFVFLVVVTCFTRKASGEDLQTTSLRATPTRCGDFCSFRFCKSDGFGTLLDFPGPRLIIRDANVATHPFVCRKIVNDPTNFINQSVKVGKTGEAQVHPASRRREVPRPFVKISKWQPTGLSPRFTKTYFKLLEILRFPPIPGEKGIAREESRGNQEDFVDDLCVSIPIRSYDLLKDDGRVDRRVARTRRKEDCVSFRTTAPTVLIELTWNSSDDLDLRVKEPNKNVISFRNTNSATGGRLIRDQNSNVCGFDPDGREQIRWGRSTNPLRGRYTITIRHFVNCMLGPTKWSLAVVINGKNKVFKMGVSNLTKKNSKITSIKFKF